MLHKDLVGFFVNKTFHVKELAYYTWNGEHRRHAYFIPVPYKTLSDKDKRTADFVRRKIHGFTYQPCRAKHVRHPDVLEPLIYTQCAKDAVMAREPWWDTREDTWRKIC